MRMDQRAKFEYQERKEKENRSGLKGVVTHTSKPQILYFSSNVAAFEVILLLLTQQNY